MKVNKITFQSFFLILTFLSLFGCSQNTVNPPTFNENNPLSLQITKTEETFCVRSGCGTSNFPDGGRLSIYSDNSLNIEGRVDGTSLPLTYEIVFSCGSLTGEITPINGLFEFAYPAIGGSFIPDACQVIINDQGSLNGQLIFRAQNRSGDRINKTLNFILGTEAID